MTKFGARFRNAAVNLTTRLARRSRHNAFRRGWAHKTAGIGFRGHAGYDLQIANVLVIGVEGGIGRGGRSLSTRTKIGDYTLKPGWNWDVSGRVGLAPASNLLVYGRAGRSWLHVSERTDFQDVKVPDLKSKNTESGFLWGAGVETALSTNVHARAEYNRANYRAGLTASKLQLGLSFGF